MKITTKSGFECEVKDRAFDDYRVVKLLSTIEAAKENKVDNGEALIATTDLFSRLLGEEQEEALITHLEELAEDGIATFSSMYEEVGSIMSALQVGKKST